jgi:hypothetical protein
LAEDVPVLTVADVVAWSGWLADHVDETSGVWLVLANRVLIFAPEGARKG